MNFDAGFTKIAGDGWHTVERLLGRLNKGPFFLNDSVAYACEIKWTNEPDGKHTGGGWNGSDFKEDGVQIGDCGKVVEIIENKFGRDYRVKWDKHKFDDTKKEWTHLYRERDLRKVPYSAPEPETKDAK